MVINAANWPRDASLRPLIQSPPDTSAGGSPKFPILRTFPLHARIARSGLDRGCGNAVDRDDFDITISEGLSGHSTEHLARWRQYERRRQGMNGEQHGVERSFVGVGRTRCCTADWKAAYFLSRLVGQWS